MKNPECSPQSLTEILVSGLLITSEIKSSILASCPSDDKRALLTSYVNLWNEACEHGYLHVAKNRKLNAENIESILAGEDLL